MKPIVWTRWQYKGKLGRWHAVSETADGQLKGKPVKAVLLACGRVRVASPITGTRPTEDACPKCSDLDDLRTKFGLKEDLGIPTTPVLVPVSVGGPADEKESSL